VTARATLSVECVGDYLLDIDFDLPTVASRTGRAGSSRDRARTWINRTKEANGRCHRCRLPLEGRGPTGKNAARIAANGRHNKIALTNRTTRAAHRAARAALAATHAAAAPGEETRDAKECGHDDCYPAAVARGPLL